jgi:hypothetical protein
MSNIYFKLFEEKRNHPYCIYDISLDEKCEQEKEEKKKKTKE